MQLPGPLLTRIKLELHYYVELDFFRRTYYIGGQRTSAEVDSEARELQPFLRTLARKMVPCLLREMARRSAEDDMASEG